MCFVQEEGQETANHGHEERQGTCCRSCQTRWEGEKKKADTLYFSSGCSSIMPHYKDCLSPLMLVFGSDVGSLLVSHSTFASKSAPAAIRRHLLTLTLIHVERSLFIPHIIAAISSHSSLSLKANKTKCGLVFHPKRLKETALSFRLLLTLETASSNAKQTFPRRALWTLLLQNWWHNRASALIQTCDQVTVWEKTNQHLLNRSWEFNSQQGVLF